MKKWFIAFALCLASFSASASYNNYDCWNGGANALANTTTGNHNIACGAGALQKVTTGNFNIGVGGKAGGAISTGSGNVVIGYNAAASLTTGSNNFVYSSLATAVDVPSATTSNWFTLDDVIVGSKTAPTASTCGTGPTLATGTSDIRGTVTTGTSATACTLTFATAKANAPSCIVTARSGTPPVYTTSTSALTLSTAAASATYDYFCSGK